MPIRVACPACDTVINAPDAAAGKVAHCPKCKAAMRLPDAPTEPDDYDDVKPTRKTAPPVDDDDRAISRYPSLRKKHGLDNRRDDDEDRPRRPPRDDDYDDDRPRRPPRDDDFDD